MSLLSFEMISPRQADSAKVVCFAAKAADIARIARIDRLARDIDGVATGFQRPQIASHIREIGDYLLRKDAILPNAIVLGFIGDAVISTDAKGRKTFTVDVSKGAPGLVVDGQQRFTALQEIQRDDFEVMVSAFICETEEELRRQFVLINNTKPIGKSLVHELLPRVSGLPHRYESLADAARVVELLNYKKGSSLRGMISGQTNPKGVITDTVLQRLVKFSMSDGAMRLYRNDRAMLESKGYELISEFFHAVRHVFRDAWDGHTQKTSRLLHSVGITAMGFVMEELHGATGAVTREDFIGPLTGLREHTAWTEGEWVLGPERRPWNSLQFVSKDWRLLTHYLVQHSKASGAKRLSQQSHVRG